MSPKRIGFIGNFIPPHSTENDRKWSFEKLGHEVITFQENQTSFRDLMQDMQRLDNPTDLYIYSHTHGWEIPNLNEFILECKKREVPTVSVHLDRWAWLARESDMGKEATWFTEYLFMADFSPEAKDLYEKIKQPDQVVYYLKPGVVERDCYMADPDIKRFPHEIVFVGSKGYHPEYPERPALIDFLRNTYGSRFGHYGNDGIGVMRGHDLNVLYATSKIAVGDSCFGGRPNYVSDRYYETRGRGGFLLHPFVDGVDRVGVAHYDPRGAFRDLKEKIDYYLIHSFEREEMRKAGHDWVKEHESYTNRATEMLDAIFPDFTTKV